MHKGILLLNFIIGLAAIAGLGYLIWRVNDDLLGIPTPAVQDMTTSPTPPPQAPPDGSIPFSATSPESTAENPASDNSPSPGAPAPSTSAGSPLTAQDGAALFKRHCATCHGEDGRGQSYVARSEGMPSVADLTQLPQRDAATIRTSIRQGKGSMPAFGGRISDADLEALYLHLIPIIHAGEPRT